MSDMMHEVEAKYRAADVEALRRRLGALGARRGVVVHEDNLILDTADRMLLNRGCGLRIRVAHTVDGSPQRRATLTYKGPRAPDARDPALKSREEIETEVADDGALLEVFHRLGFSPVIRYEKRRELWHLSDAEIALDELPQLGWFVEIEARDRDTIEAARRQLGLAISEAVSETYVELAARFGQRTVEGACCLLFPPADLPAVCPPPP